MFKKIVYYLFLIFFIGCESHHSTKILKVVAPVEPISILPYGPNRTPANRVKVQIFETLISLDSKGNFIPLLAESWTNISPTVLEIKIRQNVFFHDGKSLTVQDVKYSLDKAMSSPYLQTFLGVLKNIEIINSNTIHVHVHHESSIIVSLLAETGVWISSAYSDASNHTHECSEKCFYNGTGPFRFVEWQKGDHILLEKNPYYWGEKIAIDKIKYSFEDDAQKRFESIIDGDNHIAYDVDGDYEQDNTDIVFHQNPSSRLEYLGMTMTHKPLHDRKVREAIAMTVNIENIIANIMKGKAQIATSVISDNIPYHVKLPKRVLNIKKAKALLKSAEISNGQVIELWTLEGYREEIAYSIKKDLEQIGLELTVVILEPFVYYEAIRRGQAPMFLLSKTLTTLDPDRGLFPLLHSGSIGVGGNNFMYRSGEMDTYLNQGRKSMDVRVRQQAYKLAQELAYKDIPFIPMFHPINTVALSSKITNFEIGTTFVYNLKNIIINE